MSGFSTTLAGTGAPVPSLPDPVFESARERDAYQSIVDGSAKRGGIKIKKVKVEIFDLSDPKQVRKYERLWKELLEKTARMEVAVDSRKDLVRRADGTSFWMKYVEYTEFGEADSRSYDKNRR